MIRWHLVRRVASIPRRGIRDPPDRTMTGIDMGTEVSTSSAMLPLECDSALAFMAIVNSH